MQATRATAGEHAAALNFVRSVTVDAGNLYIVDRDNNRIRKVGPDGTITTVAGNGERGFSGDGGPATSGTLNLPVGVAVDRAGTSTLRTGITAGFARWT